MFFILAMLASSILIQQGLRTSIARCILLTAILTMLVGDGSVVACTLAFQQASMRSFGQTPYNALPLETRVSAALTVVARIIYLIGDAIVIWRAWILFNRRRVIHVVLVLCLLGTIAVSFADGAITLRVVLTNIGGDSKQKLILPIMLLVTNGITTILVGYKTWEYNKFIKSNLRAMEGDTKSNAGNVLLLLVQSGFIYCVIWFFALLASLNVFDSFGIRILGALLPSIASMYPTLVVILVFRQKTINDSGFDTSSKWTASATTSRSLRPIQFAKSPNYSGGTRRMGTGVQSSLTQVSFMTDIDLERSRGDLRGSRGVAVGPEDKDFPTECKREVDGTDVEQVNPQV
ncbi:hypothetical protein D9758_015591 [Tetrapyrgos nigripes]|uniref:Uncharacterized protein n=1 Tax=Tetrapyrgos nigripes TaxID=182062 RepID=A0A8H5FJN0_9AGAR|nr:hypothetical protein D9758_015591 [Tetrapyrgos nigripes]